MNELLDALLGTVQSIDPVLRTAIAGFGMLLETSVLVGLLVPGDTIVLVAATAVGSPLEYFALVAIVIAGALCGESIGFALGRYFGPKLRASRLGRWIGLERWDRAERYLAHRGGIAVFLSRFIPVLHSLIPVTVGSSPMRYRTFMAWTVPACLIWAFAYVSAGTFFAHGYRELSSSLHLAGYFFVGAIVLFAVLAFLAKKWISHRESRHMNAEEGTGDADALPSRRKSR